METFVHGRETSDIRLVAALSAMGIPFAEGVGTAGLSGREGVARIWRFAPQSLCGRYQVKDLSRAWRDTEWAWQNRKHPFAAVKLVQTIHRECTKALRNKLPLRKVLRDNVWQLIADANASERPAPEGLTRARATAAEWAFWSLLGFESWEGPAADVRTRLFAPKSNDGKFTAEAADVIYRDRKFIANNPESPNAYALASLLNLMRVRDAVKQDKPLVLIQKGSSLAMLHPDCSAETERKILGQFNR